MTLDEGTLRERFPEIPWDQPVSAWAEVVYDKADGHGDYDIERWVCRYCVVMLDTTRGYVTRQLALDHIEREHHD
jgi:hypothetical protein